MDELDRADIDPPRRLADQQQVGVALDLARHHQFLLVAAGKRFGGQGGRGRAHVKTLHLAGAIGADRVVVHEQPRALVFRRVVIAEGHVFPGGEIHDQAQILTVFGHMRDAARPTRLAIRRLAGQIKTFAVQPHHAGAMGNAAQHFQEFRLAISGHPGNPQNLARADMKADAFQALDVLIVTQPQVFDLQHHAAGPGGALLDLEQHLAPHHQLGQLLGAGVAGRNRRHHGAAPHHRHRVSGIHDLVQLVGDQDDGLALLFQPAQDAKQMVGLVGGQHPGRLVKDQDVGLTIKRLQDFHPLLVADRQILDPGIGIDIKFVFAREVRQHLARPPQRARQQRPRFRPEDHVFQHGEILHQLEMLEHHADPGPDRALAVGNGGQPAAHENLARIGPIKAVEDRHQGRFARAVFTDDAMDRAAHDLDRDVLVRLNRPEGL